ncbi:MAG: hypothetical protein GC179_06410 [Anaerolineaceae bacterium]|nr:hypothetical protein [Anaerolineaceae bacterium]
MVSKKVCALFISLTFLLLAACQPQEETVVLPTVAVLPSLTPSNTPTPKPTETLTPTPTDTPTATLTPTFTPSMTPTVTLSPTSTLVPPTATFTLTPTNTVTNTPVSTNTPTATNTPVATATSLAPQILAFNASATNVTANGTVTLVWSTQADSARIDVLNAQSQVSQTFNVVPSGSLPVTVPSNLGTLVIYRLTVFRGTQQDTRSVAVTVQCATAWFFGNQYAPPNSGCPSGPQTTGNGGFQAFERGFMIYINDNNRNTIFGAQNQDARFITYSNGWDSTTTYSCFGTPPNGLVAPQLVFAWVYCNTNAPIGAWSSSVGFGTTNVDTGNRTIQFEDTGAVYIDSPLGVFRFSNSSGGTWAKIK